MSSSGYGFNQQFSTTSLSLGGGFGGAFSNLVTGSIGGGSSNTLFSNFDTYIIGGTRVLHGATAAAGQPAFLGALTRTNVTITRVLKATSTVTVQGFKFVRTPEASGNWLTMTGDDMDVVLTAKSGGGGSINGGALASKTFATNSKVRSATRTALGVGETVNTYRTEYDVYTVYDATAVTLTAGTYQIVYRCTGTQIGIALFWKANVPIVTTSSIYPDPNDASNATSYPVIEVLSVAP